MPDVLDRLSTEERNRISRLFGARARSLKHHKTQVVAESDKKSPTHAFTRHGYQTGWESQLVRLVTGRTPDQPDDPDGVRDAVVKYREKNALPKKEQGKIEYAKADSVGAFLSPEVEAFAINRALAKARPLMGHFWAQTANKVGKTDWVEYDYIDMIVSVQHQLSGVSFIRQKHAPKITEAAAVQAIEDFINQTRVDAKTGQTWQTRRNVMEAMEDVGVAGPNYRLGARSDHPLRFPNMSDLLAFLGVEAAWMRNVNVVFRRFDKAGKDWRVHTAFCVGHAAQASPTRGGPSVKTGKWTGRLRREKDGPETFVPPDWFG